MEGEDFVTIPTKRYKQLLQQEDKLECLEAGGVDNWEWYSDSLSDQGYFERVEEGEYE